MDYRNKAIANPDAFQVNTAKMRCLTKCISMMGLGMYIYAGEDLPDQAAEERYKALKAEDELKAYQELCAKHQDSIDVIKMGIVDDDYSSAYEAWRELGEDLQGALWRAPTKGGCFTTEERNIMKTPEFRQA